MAQEAEQARSFSGIVKSYLSPVGGRPVVVLESLSQPPVQSRLVLPSALIEVPMGAEISGNGLPAGGVTLRVTEVKGGRQPLAYQRHDPLRRPQGVTKSEQLRQWSKR